MTDTLPRICKVLTDLKLNWTPYGPMQIDPRTTLSDELGMDSMDTIEVAGALELEFGIELDDADMWACVEVGDLVNVVDHKREKTKGDR